MPESQKKYLTYYQSLTTIRYYRENHERGNDDRTELKFSPPHQGGSAYRPSRRTYEMLLTKKLPIGQTSLGGFPGRGAEIKRHGAILTVSAIASVGITLTI